MKKKLIIAITGASGAIYAMRLLKKLTILSSQWDDCALIFSDNARDIWNFELENVPLPEIKRTEFAPHDFYAPFASGSSDFNIMIVCPCSMGTLGRIASGVSNDLITRAADVMLKERRQLILVSRETPLNLIHLQNMKLLTEAGAIICPASPSFYQKPKRIEDAVDTVVDRVLSLAGFEVDMYRWEAKK
ncbi:MAG: UbiX family flavin prenyltransferase [Bacteroidota bacterium]